MCVYICIYSSGYVRLSLLLLHFQDGRNSIRDQCFSTNPNLRTRVALIQELPMWMRKRAPQETANPTKCSLSLRA